MTATNPFWLAFGDLHGDFSKALQIQELSNAEAVIITGDITNAGRTNEADNILQKLSAVNPKIYAQIGNMDYPEIITYLEQQGWNIHAKGVWLGPDLGLIGLGYSNPTPFFTPSEVDDTTLNKWLEKAHEEIKDAKQVMLVSHTPPFGCQADCLPNGKHVGSTAVKHFIEKYQPDICITGHIHEAVTEDWIGRTKIINPGMISAGGYVIIEKNHKAITAQLAFIES